MVEYGEFHFAIRLVTFFVTWNTRFRALIQFELRFGRYLVHRVTDGSGSLTWMFFNQPLASHRTNGKASLNPPKRMNHE